MTSDESNDQNADWKKLAQKDNHLSKQFRASVNKSQSHVNEKAIVTKEQIERLKAQITKPTLEYTPSPTGNLSNTYDPNKNRKLMHQVKAKVARLAEQSKEMSQSFAKTSMKGIAKQTFNQSVNLEM